MARRTWKRRQLSDDAIREALKAAGGNAAAAAEHLGVHRSSLSRWIRADPSLAPDAATRNAPAVVQPSPDMSPHEWRDWVLATFELDGVELQLLALAVEALTMARDQLYKPSDRMQAASRFQSLVKQMQLPDPQPEANEHGEAEESGQPKLYRVK